MGPNATLQCQSLHDTVLLNNMKNPRWSYGIITMPRCGHPVKCNPSYLVSCMGTSKSFFGNGMSTIQFGNTDIWTFVDRYFAYRIIGKLFALAAAVNRFLIHLWNINAKRKMWINIKCTSSIKLMQNVIVFHPSCSSKAFFYGSCLYRHESLGILHFSVYTEKHNTTGV